MQKTINKSINYSFILLVIIASVVTFIPKETKAFAGFTYRDESGRNFIYNYNTGKSYPYQPPVPATPPPLDESLPFVQGSKSTTATLNPAPIIYSTTPDAMPSEKGKLTATINGANFVRGSVVKWNSFDRETRYIDSNHLTVRLTAEDMAGSGEYIISVFNPAPGGGYSNGSVFALGGDVRNVATKTSIDSADNKSLAANAFFGAGSFMPRSLIQWIFFVILILLGIVLWRRIYVTHEKKNAPLKHA